MYLQNKRSLRHIPYLWLLSGLWLMFLLRVLAQLLQKWYPVPFLPAFDRWYSGVLSYGWLFSAQLGILIAMGWLIERIRQEKVLPRRGYGFAMIGAGSVYFTVMLLRLILGLTIANTHPWLALPIPAVFHLVLALFLIVLGHYHLQRKSAEATI